MLSGFVIAYVTDQRETSAATYTISRLARVYSVSLPAMIATFTLDTIGRTLRPDLYSEAWDYVAEDR